MFCIYNKSLLYVKFTSSKLIAVYISMYIVQVIYLFYFIMKKVVVIGAGMWGFSSALLLAQKGYNVTIIEKNDKPGWRLNLLEKKGYKWDMGPSRYLMPDIFENFFISIGKKIEDYLDLKKLTPNYRIYYTHKKESSSQEPFFMDIYSDIEKTKAQFEQLEPGSWKKLEEYLAIARSQYDVAMNTFVFKDYNSIRELFTFKILKQAFHLPIFSTLYRYVSRFINNEDLKKALLYTTVFLWTSPYEASAAYNIMSHLDFNEGVFYPQWGIYQISKALESIAHEFGITIVYNSPVDKILVENGQVKGVQSGNTNYPADIVISNADMRFTETQLLDQQYQTYPESYRSKKTLSPSWFIMYLGVDGKLPQLIHHTLIFANDRKTWFDNIFHTPKRSESPNYYICKPTHVDPSVAPPGKENLFIFVPIAPWMDEKKEFLKNYGDKILDDIAKNCNIPDIKQRIEVCEYFSTSDFRSYYNAYKWTALWLAHTFDQSAVLRPKNQSKKVSGLYYVGGYTTPGIWVPMCLLSWELVAAKILKQK